MAMRIPNNIPVSQDVFSQGTLPYQRIDSSAADFGGATAQAIGGVAQAIGQAGQETSQTALLRQQYANVNSSTQGLTGFYQKADALSNGDPQNGIVGFNTLQGKDAVDQQGAYQQQLQQAYNDARASLNPAAQRMFDERGMWALRSYVSRMGDHAAQQQNVYDYREARAGVQTSQQAALDGADDPNTWASGLAAVQEASLRSSKVQGLDGDAAEATRQRDLSDLYIGRVRQLEQRDPVAAQKFYQDNIGMFAADQRYAVERELNYMTDSRYAAMDGTTAYANATGRAPAGPLPQNYNADTVKPYSQQQIDSIVAQVKAPSQYDSIINTAATKYGIDATDLKMRLVAESGLRPDAVSSQGAKGIAQLTDDTAKSLGVDPMNPAQAIDGAARLIVRAQSGNTTDRSAVDRAYYGGSPAAQGPNTDQYVSNLGAVRNNLYGPNAGAPLTADELEGKRADIEAQARSLAESRKPGDPVYADRVVAEADKNLSRQIQDIRGQDYSNMQTVLNATIKGGFQSSSELSPELQATYAHLTMQDQASVNKVMRDNQRAASGEFTPSDPKVFNDAQNRINLPAGDPNRLTDPSQITPLIAHGLSFSDANKLIGEMKDLNSPATNPFMKQVNGVKQDAHRMLTINPSALLYPQYAEEASYRFGFALDRQIASMRAAGKDPSVLFDPSSPQYALLPSRVMSFMPTEQEMVADQAKTPTKPSGTTANPFAPPTPPAPFTGRPGGVQLTPSAAARVNGSGASVGPVLQRRPGETPQQYLARVGAAQQ